MVRQAHKFGLDLIPYIQPKNLFINHLESFYLQNTDTETNIEPVGYFVRDVS